MSEPFLIDLAARAIGLLLEASVVVRFRVAVRGRHNFTRSPSTLIVFNHRRDADIEIIGTVLYGGRAFFLPHRLKPSFVAREDMFRPAFLTNFLTDWPWPLRRLLAPLNLWPVFVVLHAYPMRRIAERTLGEVLEDMLPIFGNLPLSDVLKKEWVAQFESMTPPVKRPLHLKDVIKDRFRYRSLLIKHYGLLKLTHDRFRKIRPYEAAVIRSQLDKFVELLNQGEILQMAPEGAVSLDGRFSRIRVGLHVLLNRPHVDVRVLPVGVTYDPMDLGRTRVFLNIGPEITGLRGLKPSEASVRVTQAILNQSTITASHLAGQFILELEAAGKRLLTRADLDRYVEQEARRWAGRGMYVDPRLLNRKAREKRITRYLQHATRAGNLRDLGGDRYRTVPSTAGPPANNGDAHKRIDFVVNQLVSLAGTHRVFDSSVVTVDNGSTADISAEPPSSISTAQE